MSSYFNKFTGVGRLTRDPETHTLPSGNVYCKMRLAMNKSYKNREGEREEKTCFVNVKTWGNLAKLCADRLTKGKLILAEGELSTYTIEKPEVGPISVFEVIAREIIFMDRPSRQLEQLETA